ncbi:DUF6210 family protein [Brevifollis gellanilyticus]|uniref:Uncharacterized protein n=1 Tax=Brevifollis gellanilyticus TaxID=748831 RepID=A0A512M6P7_9BACT|nr:DUF6210 family protein [Brevifollis gellanilyticus]GEP42394.1 hypothetical protein BGE01nite_16850 [Brevifollis gellanilyticus]
MPKPTIRLYDTVGTGLIIGWKSGVIISNQTGGFSCLQPEMEGIYVPLRNDYRIEGLVFESPEIELSAYFRGPKHRGSGAVSGLDVIDADFIDGVLQRANLSRAVMVDRGRLRDSNEAWVHVTLIQDEWNDPSLGVFAGFGPYPRPAILTWSNSD